jgi:hypothetical protein
MATHWIKPRRLAAFLRESLDNGQYRLTYKEIASSVFGVKAPTIDDIDEIRARWHAAEKRLRKRGICAILVTQFYFDTYDRHEPKGAQQIALCIALAGRAAAGIRLLSMKGQHNDPMALMYFRLRSSNLHGQESAILDRITIESMKGKLTKPVARTLADTLTEPALPAHEREFAKLMSGSRK